MRTARAAAGSRLRHDEHGAEQEQRGDATERESRRRDRVVPQQRGQRGRGRHGVPRERVVERPVVGGRPDVERQRAFERREVRRADDVVVQVRHARGLRMERHEPEVAHPALEARALLRGERRHGDEDVHEVVAARHHAVQARDQHVVLELRPRLQLLQHDAQPRERLQRRDVGQVRDERLPRGGAHEVGPRVVHHVGEDAVRREVRQVARQRLDGEQVLDLHHVELLDVGAADDREVEQVVRAAAALDETAPFVGHGGDARALVQAAR